jgi:hypothetical protein
MQSPNQTVPTPPAAPAIRFDDSINDYPATFDVQAGVSGIPLSVALLEDGVYHVNVTITTTSVPTNGYQLQISGDNTIVEMGDDYSRYIAPLAYPSTQLDVAFRGGPSRGLNVYAYVRQRSGNAAFDIDWSDTFMEIYKIGPVVGNPT